MDLRIGMRPLGVPRMGPPVIATGAPVTVPNAPYPSPPTMPPGQVAARARAGVGCPSPDGIPGLRDIAPGGFFSKIPRWALWLGGAVGLGLTGWLVIALIRRGR